MDGEFFFNGKSLFSETPVYMWKWLYTTHILLCSGNELPGVIPVLQQVGGLLIVHTDVVVLEKTREEVIDLPRHIQDIANPVRHGE